MADTVENEDKPTDDAPEVETPAQEVSEPETPEVEAPEISEPNYAQQIADLTERLNAQSDQIEVLVNQVASLREENADLIESVVDDIPIVTDSHNTGDDFLDELFV